MRYLILSFLGNCLAFLAAGFLVSGFDISGSVKAFLVLMAFVTLVHVIVRPILKLIFSPLILITLGLFSFVINVIILYVIDIYSQNISITGLMALLLGTLIISFVNILVKPASH